MKDKIIELLERGESYINIFNLTSCTTDAFLAALNEFQDEYEYVQVAFDGRDVVAY